MKLKKYIYILMMVLLGVAMNLGIEQDIAKAGKKDKPCEDDKCYWLSNGEWACTAGTFSYNCDADGDNCYEQLCN